MLLLVVVEKEVMVQLHSGIDLTLNLEWPHIGEVLDRLS